jgi:hypothetical protein
MSAFFASELNELQAMGFLQPTKGLLLLLQHYRGDVRAVVCQLLDQPYQPDANE